MYFLTSVLIKLEYFFVGPYIGAVVIDIHRNVAHDPYALGVCVSLEFLPLHIEEILLFLKFSDPGRPELKELSHDLVRIREFIFARPLVPWKSVLHLLYHGIGYIFRKPFIVRCQEIIIALDLSSFPERDILAYKLRVTRKGSLADVRRIPEPRWIQRQYLPNAKVGTYYVVNKVFCFSSH